MASRGWMYAKMTVVFFAVAAGGPALMYYVTPAEGVIFSQFNPDLQKKSLALKDERLRQQEAYFAQLKEYAKSDKNIWIAMKEAEEKAREEAARKKAEETALQGQIREQMRAAQIQR